MCFLRILKIVNLTSESVSTGRISKTSILLYCFIFSAIFLNNLFIQTFGQFSINDYFSMSNTLICQNIFT